MVFILALSRVFSRVFDTIFIILYYNKLTVWFSARDLTGIQFYECILLFMIYLCRHF